MSTTQNHKFEVNLLSPASLFLFLCLCCTSSVFAVTTSFWEVRDFTECKLTNVKLDKNGIASLAPQIECVWENPEVYLWAILKKGNTLYVGTGASGRIYKIEKGKSSLLFDTKEVSVFSLAMNRGKIYAGTSPNGKIFVISQDGKGEVFVETGEKYIWKLVFDDANNLYAATGTDGKILKITESSKFDTFYTTGRMNVSFLTYFSVDPGKLPFYAGTGEDALLFKIDHQGKGFCIYDAPEEEITGVLLIDSMLFVSTTIDSQGTIYLIHPDNKIERIWQIDSPIRGIQKSGSKIFVAAGKRIYKVDKDGTSELLAELPIPMSCISLDGTSLLIGTSEVSEVGKLYKLDPKTSKSGTIESISYDTKSISKWGILEYSPTNGAKIEFRTRSGNVKEPDATWEEWKSIGGDYKIKSTPARFIQWEATLKSSESEIREVRVPFLPQNEKPEILEIKVIITHAKASEEKSLFPIPQVSKVVWKVVDPNGDDLIFNLYFKTVDEKEWTVLKKELKDTFYIIDPKSFPDGEYEFKVEAYDSPSNLPENVLRNEHISKPRLIDNTHPIIRIGKVKDKIFYFEITDNHCIKSCEYALDGGEWKVTAPIDGLFDSKNEKFKINVGGTKKIVIRAQDIYGNTVLNSKLIK